MPAELFHRTDDSEAIMASGFKDGTDSYMTRNEYSGVWLSSVPLDANEGAFGDTLLLVELDVPEAELTQFEWIEEGKGFREWLIPPRSSMPKARFKSLRRRIKNGRLLGYLNLSYC